MVDGVNAPPPFAKDAKDGAPRIPVPGHKFARINKN